MLDVFRFLCSRTFPVTIKDSYSNENEMFATALSLLRNGDVNTAVRLLNAHG